MSYIYISESRLSKGGVKVSEEGLSSLSESVIKSAIANKVIKKKNERRKDTEEKEVLQDQG